MPECVVCEKGFEAARSDARYCSPKCRKAASRVTDTVVTDNGTPDVTANEAGEERVWITEEEKATYGKWAKVEDPKLLYAEADRLVELQRKERGLIDWPPPPEKPKFKVMGPYVKTAREARANLVLFLRRKAAHIEHPIQRRVGA